MSPIEIRLDPALVESLLETIQPVLDSLQNELASPAELPEDDDLMENFWKNDLLNSQREEIAVIADLFGEEFMQTGRAVIEPDDMDRVMRCCSAIRLRIRDTLLKELDDDSLERGDFQSVNLTEELQIGYAAYSLFASLQELMVRQILEPMEGDDDWSEDLDGEDDES